MRPVGWSWRRELNPRPADYKSAALPLSYASDKPRLYQSRQRLASTMPEESGACAGVTGAGGVPGGADGPPPRAPRRPEAPLPPLPSIRAGVPGRETAVGPPRAAAAAAFRSPPAPAGRGPPRFRRRRRAPRRARAAHRACCGGAGAVAGWIRPRAGMRPPVPPRRRPPLRTAVRAAAAHRGQHRRVPCSRPDGPDRRPARPPPGGRRRRRRRPRRRRRGPARDPRDRARRRLRPGRGRGPAADDGAQRDRPHVAGHHAALPHHLVQRDPRRHRDVERAHVPEQRQRHQVVAPLAHQPADAAAFPAEDQRDRPPIVHGVPALRARRRRSRPPTRPRAFSSSMACETLPMRATWTCSRPPAEERLTVSDSPALWRSGSSTPSAPAASTVRRIAPRLRGSSTPSRRTSSAGVRAPSSSFSRVITGLAETTATSPWCGMPPAMRSRVSRGSNRSGIPSWLARAIASDTRWLRIPLTTSRRSKWRLPAVSASMTGLMPQIRFIASYLRRFAAISPARAGRRRGRRCLRRGRWRRGRRCSSP